MGSLNSDMLRAAQFERMTAIRRRVFMFDLIIIPSNLNQI